MLYSSVWGHLLDCDWLLGASHSLSENWLSSPRTHHHFSLYSYSYGTVCAREFSYPKRPVEGVEFPWSWGSRLLQTALLGTGHRIWVFWKSSKHSTAEPSPQSLVLWCHLYMSLKWFTSTPIYPSWTFKKGLAKQRPRRTCPHFNGGCLF